MRSPELLCLLYPSRNDHTVGRKADVFVHTSPELRVKTKNLSVDHSFSAGLMLNGNYAISYFAYPNKNDPLLLLSAAPQV